MLRTIVRLFSVVLLLAAISLVVVYMRADLETLELTEVARQAAPGKFVDLSAGKTHYDIGEPSGISNDQVVILIHGFSVPYYIWDTTFRHLSSAGFRVVRYDLYGRGYSDRPDLPYDGALFERQITDLVSALQLQTPVSIVGLSMGGAVAMRYAANNPNTVRRIVLLDPVHEKRDKPPYPRPVGKYLIAVSVVPGMAEGQLSDFLYPEKYPNWVDRYREQTRYEGFSRAISSTIYDFLPEDHLHNYRKVSATGLPVKLIWGKQDRTLPATGAAIVQSAIPNVDYMPVENAGHLPHIEQAATVNTAIAAFLQPVQDVGASLPREDETLVEDD